jgi:hypothetical protein
MQVKFCKYLRGEDIRTGGAGDEYGGNIIYSCMKVER